MVKSSLEDLMDEMWKKCLQNSLFMHLLVKKKGISKGQSVVIGVI